MEYSNVKDIEHSITRSLRASVMHLQIQLYLYIDRDIPILYSLEVTFGPTRECKKNITYDLCL